MGIHWLPHRFTLTRTCTWPRVRQVRLLLRLCLLLPSIIRIFSSVRIGRCGRARKPLKLAMPEELARHVAFPLPLSLLTTSRYLASDQLRIYCLEDRKMYALSLQSFHPVQVLLRAYPQ